jgi:hypothetical protein
LVLLGEKLPFSHFKLEGGQMNVPLIHLEERKMILWKNGEGKDLGTKLPEDLTRMA